MHRGSEQDQPSDGGLGWGAHSVVGAVVGDMVGTLMVRALGSLMASRRRHTRDRSRGEVLSGVVGKTVHSSRQDLARVGGAVFPASPTPVDRAALLPAARSCLHAMPMRDSMSQRLQRHATDAAGCPSRPSEHRQQSRRTKRSHSLEWTVRCLPTDSRAQACRHWVVTQSAIKTMDST